jgi:hypothetical protein
VGRYSVLGQSLLRLIGVKATIDRWLNAVGIQEGYVFRPVNKGSRVGGERMTDAGVYAVLKTYAELAPHDLRRSFAQMARRANCSIEQIQLSLGARECVDHGAVFGNAPGSGGRA